MKIADFKLERYFAKWEFVAPYLLGSSDAESFGLDELLSYADEKSLELWHDLRLGYTETPGHPLLREEIARLYSGVAADDILTFAGSEEAIFAFMNVALGKGDHVVVTWPAYQSLLEPARVVGADVTPLRLRYENRWKLDLDELSSHLRPNTRAVVINTPHNPTGMHLERETFAELAALCERRNMLLFVDEMYRFGEYRDADRLPGACDATPLGVSLGGLSKPFGLAGLRVGWIALRDRALRHRLSTFKDYLTICSSAPSEILAIIALRAKEKLLARNRAIILENLGLLDDFFHRHSSMFEWVRPRAGLVAFPRMRSALSVDDFAAKLVEATGVLIVPESVFDHKGNHFRIGLGRKNMPEALLRLENFVSSEPLALGKV